MSVQMVLKESALISVTGLVDLMRQTEVAAGSTRLPFLFYAAAAVLYTCWLTTASAAICSRGAERGSPARGMADRLIGVPARHAAGELLDRCAAHAWS